MKISKFLFLGVIFTCFALSAQAGQKGSSCGSKKCLEEKLYHKAHTFLIYEEELGLTEEKVKKIKELKHETKKELIRSKADIEIIAVDIWAELYNNPIDVDAVNKLIDQKYEIKKAKTKALIQALATLKATLSEEQYATMKKIWKDSKKNK